MAKTYNSLTVANATAGNAILASDQAKVFENVNNYRVPPMVKCTRSGNLSYTANDNIAWNDTEYDTETATPGSGAGAMHDDVTNNARITPTTAGVYLVTFSVHYTFTGTSSTFTMRMLKNGAEVLTRLYAVARTTLHKDSISIIDAANGSTDFYTCQFEMAGASVLSVQASSGSYFAANWLGQTT
jgi:hypothetical protein